MGRRKGRVEIYGDWCKKCGICTEFCPHHALATGKDGFPVLQHPEKCKGCDWCEIRCPDFAILVRKDEKREEK